MSFLLLSLLAALHLEGDVMAGSGDYTLLTFEVPAGTKEIRIEHSDGSPDVILDWGVWAPDGFRGWGGGLTEDAVIGEEMSSRGYLPGPIAPGVWTLVIGHAKLVDGKGHYVVDITTLTAPTLVPVPRAPFQPVVLSTGSRWYKGDFHVHCEESGDSTATFPQVIGLARERGLDFMVQSDHNTVSQQGRAAAAQEDLPDLLLVRGIEVTTYGGHGNAIGVGEYVDHRVGLGGVGAASIVADVDGQGGAFIINHPKVDFNCIGCVWALADTPWDQIAGIEILTGDLNVAGNLYTPGAIEMWDDHLDQGNRIAAIGGSDDHRAGVGEGVNGTPIGTPTTLVWADELSEAAIVEGVKAGRTQVLFRGPDDAHVELTVADRNGQPVMIGGTATDVTSIALSARVVGAAAGTQLVVYRDGVAVDRAAVVGDDFRQDFQYPVRGGPERFRAELEENDTRVVVTSHVYVEGVQPAPDAGPPPAEGDGGGCGAGGPGAGGWPAIGLVLAWLRRRRRTAPTPAPSPRRSSSPAPPACPGGSI